MNLWIIYKKGMVISKIIAELLEDQLEDYIDVSLGTSDKIDPSYLLEEKLDYLIIGDIISETIPSMQIQNWLRKYGECAKDFHKCLKILSGFYIILTDIASEHIWMESLQRHINAEIIYPSILRLKVIKTHLDLNEVIELVKKYSNDIIEFLLNNKQKK